MEFVLLFFYLSGLVGENILGPFDFITMTLKYAIMIYMFDFLLIRYLAVGYRMSQWALMISSISILRKLFRDYYTYKCKSP